MVTPAKLRKQAIHCLELIENWPPAQATKHESFLGKTFDPSLPIPLTFFRANNITRINIHISREQKFLRTVHRCLYSKFQKSNRKSISFRRKFWCD